MIGSPRVGAKENSEKESFQQPKVGARLGLFWRAWERYQIDPWVLSVLKEGYKIPFHQPPPLSPIPQEFPSYLGNQEKHSSLQKEVLDMINKGAIEEISYIDPGFYNRLFLVQKASGAWRPVLDVSRLNKFVIKTKFSMETIQSVLDSIQQDDWMISIDMKDAYFHVPIHPESRPYLRFCFDNKIFQFRALCFGLSTAPQVFTRVLAPLSKIVHLAGFRMILYLDDWLVIGKTKEELLKAKKFILNLVQELGIVLNLEKSVLEPSQVTSYLGVQINSSTLWASPTEKRVNNALSLISEFVSCGAKPAKSWQSLLGHMSSLEKLVPGARIRMRSLQFHLNREWDRVSQSALISIPPSLFPDLSWWNNKERLSRGISLRPKTPHLQLFSDASRKGWGAVIEDLHLSGKWSQEQQSEHINLLELRAVWIALQQAIDLVKGKVVSVFSDNKTALAYIAKQGGTKSWPLFNLVKDLFVWLESHNICLIPQFISGERNVVADSLSRKGQVIPTEWTLHHEVCQRIWRLWGQPSVDLFATSLNKRLQNYMSPHADPQAVAVDALLQDWSNADLYAFPPFAILRKVINKFRNSPNSRMTLIAPWWPQREWFPDLIALVVEEPRQLPLRQDLLTQPLGRALHQNLPMLHLTAWRLSTISSDSGNFQTRWQSQFIEQEGSQLMPSTNKDGVISCLGAGLGNYLPPDLP